MEGVKEEVILSPAHALSLIAAGEGTISYNPICIGSPCNLGTPYDCSLHDCL